MIKVFRCFAICAISVAFATLSIAWAQTYTTVDYPGACPGSTSLNGGPNLEGTSVGTYYDAATCTVLHGFTLTAKGKFTTIDPPGSTGTTPNFINLQGVIVGGYLDSKGTSHGFVLDEGKYTTVDDPKAAGTSLTGINDFGELSGYSCSLASCTGDSLVTHSFVVPKKGDFVSFDPPEAVSSVASTVSLLGAVVGGYTDSGGEGHGYLLFFRKYTTIDFPKATFTFGGGGNLQNDIVGEYTDAASVDHSFLLSHGVYKSFDPPGAVFSAATGINALGVIVGVYEDSSDAYHGYIRTPKQ